MNVINTATMTEQQVIDAGWEQFGRNALDAVQNEFFNKVRDAYNAGPDKDQMRRYQIMQGIMHELNQLRVTARLIAPQFNPEYDPTHKFGVSSVAWIGAKLEVPPFSSLALLSITEERSRVTSFRSVANGKYRVTYGSHGSKNNFPQRKDGSFNYAAIAQLIKNDVARAEIKARQAAVQGKNKETTDRLAKHLDVVSYDSAYRLTPSSVEDKPCFVTIDIKRAMTPGQAMAIYQMLDTMGFVISNKDRR